MKTLLKLFRWIRRQDEIDRLHLEIHRLRGELQRCYADDWLRKQEKDKKG